MMSYIYVFSSRNESMAFNEYLNKNGINSHLIATPKECMVGCGLSVNVSEYSWNASKAYYYQFPYKYTFKGMYILEKIGLRSFVKKIN